MKRLKTYVISWSGEQELITQAAKIIAGAMLLFAMSQISIPLNPVPINLGSLAVMIIGLVYDRRSAVYAVMSFLALGAAGVPVFANFSGGFWKLCGPTGGYLAGYLIAVLAMTSVREYFKAEKIWQLSLISILGSALLYTCGIIWLSRFVGVENSIALGLTPFILPGIIKIFLLAIAISYLKKANYEQR